MPFTPSHAVVALPFVGTRLVPAAVAVGAMTPDLPLFVRWSPLAYGRTHDLAWLPATTAVALLLLLVWRCVLRPASRELAPGPIAARLPAEWDRGFAEALRETVGLRARRADATARWSVSWRDVALVVASLAIGVASHIVWDLFTHEGRWGTEVVPVLAEPWGPLEGFRWLQHVSTAAGLIVLAIWAVRWLSRRDAEASVPRILPSWVRAAWWISLPAILLIAWVGGLAILGPFRPDLTPAHLAYRVLPPACAVWAAFTLALAVVIRASRARRAAIAR